MNEEESKELVSRMYHIENGRKYIGEKFDLHKAEKAFCFYHCKGFRDTKRCFCDSKCKDAQEFIQFLDYIVVKTKEDDR